ncbi:MAG TPA: SpoIIE family protein phosphatase [Jatrophihabitans sp.]|nr:SpoIIE family protein phosphatase [Jatrophihabitans sp.]
MTERDAAPAPDGVLFDPSTQLGRDLAAVDWAATPLGAPATWPASLRSVIRLLLGSRFAMWMAWGSEYTFFCNDAYRRNTLGAKYPWALGRPASEVWAEIWPDIGPRIESVISTGNATWDEDLLLFLERSGYPEETYHTFSYSPIYGDDGTVSGMLCVVSEETGRVVSERRMRIVRDLGTALAAAASEADVCAAAGRQLGLDAHSLPFTLGYLFCEDADEAGQAELMWAAGIDRTHELAPARIDLDDENPVWPAREILDGRVHIVEDLGERFSDVPSGAWPDPPVHGMLVPFTQVGEAKPFGFLVIGLNRYRRLDGDYQGFIELVAGQIAAAVTRARAFEQERRRAEDLAELDRAKTAFFTNVSHELRTPLTLLLGPAADALADGDDPLPPAQRQRLEVIERNGERLLKLVNMLLDFSRMESGRMQPRFEALDLAKLTSELAAMFDSAATRAGLTLTVDCRPLPHRAHIDREMWAKIVLNLVSNALKATFAGGITVRLTERDGAAELQVVDTGVGIPPDEQHRLFERFHRVSGARLRSHEGSGIGLALVSELAALHGGTVTVDSEPDRGSTFSVRIPIGTDHLPPELVASAPATDEIPLEKYGAGYVAEATRWLRSESDADEVSDERMVSGRPRILVADDNADMRDYLHGLLSPAYAVRTAVDGRAALEAALEWRPDLVLTDVMMPRLDGFGLLQALREAPETMHVPVVMLSARSGEEAAVEGLEAGADDYLVKPFSARELLARIRANLELDRVRRVVDELDRNRSLLDQAEELAHVGSWELDLENHSMRASAEYARIFGMSADELAERGLAAALDRVREDDRQRVRDALAATARLGTPLDVELRVDGLDDTPRIVRAHGVLHRGPTGIAEYIRGSVQDITDQRAAELAVAASAAAREAAAREHFIAEELQRSMLPARTPAVGGLDIAAYYVSGTEETQAGGDWYDVIELGGGRTALVIGDVMGRGVHAAAVMGQLRSAVRAYALLDLPPGKMLQLLDRSVRDGSDSTIVTCVYAVHDAEQNTLTYANAGHMPPLLVPPGDGVRRLSGGDPPLGTGRYTGDVETVLCPPGARLMLYTDGLVERRGSDIDAGIDRLAALLAAEPLPAEALPNAVAAALLPADPDDDVAMLVVTARRPDTRELFLPVAPVETSVGEARRAAVAALGEWGVADEVIDDAALIVSELITNALRYGDPPIEFRLRLASAGAAPCLVVDVSDGASPRPHLRDMDPAAPNGRGLHLVAALADRWGTRPTGVGKSVWCTLPAPAVG